MFYGMLRVMDEMQQRICFVLGMEDFLYMVDENGNICLLIKFTSYYDYEKKMWLPSMMNLPGGILGDRECHWSLVEDTDDFELTYWFSYEDYEIYQPWQIREKFYTKRTKLNEKKLSDAGFYKVEGKNYSWAYQWFFHTLRLSKLETYFSEIEKNEQWSQFRMFAKMVGLRNETLSIQNWLRLDIALKWCEEHSIPYKLDIPKGYQKDYPKAALNDSAEKIRYTTKERGVMPPFDWLNGMKDSSLFMAEF